MELRTLKYFLTVASELNITHAAQKLNISQPPLSRQLAQREEELGVKLFIRGKRRIQLTEEGKYLAQQAENILNMAEHTTQQLTQMQSNTVKGTLALGVTETCSANILTAILPEFSKLYPLVSYDVWSGSSNDVCQRIEQGVADIGIVRDPPKLNSFDSHYLRDEAWIAVVSRSHPLAEKAAITLDQLCCEPLFIPSRQPLKTEIQQWFSTAAKSATVMGFYTQISSIIPMIIQNMGAAICPESVRRYTDDRQVAYLKIEKPEHMSRLYMISARNKLLPACGKTFWSFVKQYISAPAG